MVMSLFVAVNRSKAKEKAKIEARSPGVTVKAPNRELFPDLGMSLERRMADAMNRGVRERRLYVVVLQRDSTFLFATMYFSFSRNPSAELQKHSVNLGNHVGREKCAHYSACGRWLRNNPE